MNANVRARQKNTKLNASAAMLVVYVGNNLRSHIHTTHLIPNFQTREQPGFAPDTKRAALGRRSTLLLSTLLDKDLHPLFVIIFPAQLYINVEIDIYICECRHHQQTIFLNLLNSAPHHSPSALYLSVFTLCTPRGLHFKIPPSSPVANSRIYIRALKSVPHPCV